MRGGIVHRPSDESVMFIARCVRLRSTCAGRHRAST